MMTADKAAEFLQLYRQLDAPSRRIAERILTALEYAETRGWRMPARIDLARQLQRP